MAAPIAHAGANQTRTFAQLNSLVALNGDGSTPGVTYKWYMLSKPPGSGVTFIDGDDVESTRIQPDVVGTYLLFLVVTLGAEVSESNPLKAPDLARMWVTVTTENEALELPASGQRNWTDKHNEAVRRLDTKSGLLTDHLDGAAGQHDATEINYERGDGSKKSIQDASDDVELALTDLDDAVGDLAALNTAAESLVAAINEVETGTGSDEKYFINATSKPAALPNSIHVKQDGGWEGVGAPFFEFGKVVASLFGLQHGDVATALVKRTLALYRHSNGNTPAAGFGAGIEGQLESDNNVARAAAAIDWLWTSAADTAEAAKIRLSTMTAGALEAIVDFTDSGDIDLVTDGEQAILKRGGAGALVIGTEHASRLQFLVSDTVRWFIETDGRLIGLNYRISGVADPTAQNDVLTSRAAPGIVAFWGSRFLSGDVNADRWLWPFMSADVSSSSKQFIVPVKGHVKRIDVFINGTVCDEATVFTLMKDTGGGAGLVATDLVATVAADGTTANDTGAAEYAVGDKMALKAKMGAGATTYITEVMVAVHFAGPHA